MIVTEEVKETYQKQFQELGNKVADCVMLFSLDKLEAFPSGHMDNQEFLQNTMEKNLNLTQKRSQTNSMRNLHKEISKTILDHMQDIHNNFSSKWKEKIIQEKMAVNP